MNRLALLVGAACLLLTIACNSHSEKKAQLDGVVQFENFAAPNAPDTAVIPVNEKTEEGQPTAPSSKGNVDWDKKIVKTGTLNIEAERYTEYDNGIRQAVRKWGGYIASEKANGTNYKKENAVIIKVPVAFFDEAMQELSAMKGKVIDKEISTADVTGEFVDTRARMEAKKRVRQRYVDILHQAKNVEEVLQVEKEINDMQEEIEAAAGRINYLAHSAAYSTIQLTYYQVLDPDAANDTSPGFAKRIWMALSDGAKGMSEVIIMLVALWPLWIAVAFVVWVIKKGITSKSGTKLLSRNNCLTSFVLRSRRY